MTGLPRGGNLTWTFVLSVGATAAARSLSAGATPSQRWDRENHAGRPVTLLEGVWCVTGTTTALLITTPASALVALGAGLTGAYDDLHPDAERKGLRGHLTALRRGQVSSGTLKIVGLLGSGLLGAIWPGRRGVDLLLDTAVTAGAANLINLLDLRPGRALKVTLAAGVPLMIGLRSSAAAAGVAAAVVLLPADLAGTTMLGDTGANALGALLGVSASPVSRPRRLLVLAALTTLTLASERVSFSAVIDGNATLSRLDRWGRPVP